MEIKRSLSLLIDKITNFEKSWCGGGASNPRGQWDPRGHLSLLLEFLCVCLPDGRSSSPIYERDSCAPGIDFFSKEKKIYLFITVTKILFKNKLFCGSTGDESVAMRLGDR